ncbi:MAG: restriction endonuclease, partial [Gammaproteobacteria bacterium]|nr:restriction endonuclease [Gammaproteobacteria bacterium]MBU1731880.1 restriction endonuclease [Gammaproteobacteria bacterium]MBU1891274.1 restriction endonuclease [Gammaproteobacteria bacterium]
NQIIIGWGEADGLLEPSLSWEQFREVIRSVYYTDEKTLRKAGAASGHMWRFVREMNVGDLVVVPYGSEFFVAKIEGPATYNPAKLADDTAYRRAVQWLNGKKQIRRDVAKSALISRMKTQGTCAYATDLLDEIEECLLIVSKGQAPTFQTDLQSRLIRDTLEELRKGRLDSFGFERLIQTVLTGLGAEDARIVPRLQDKGADILATFLVAGAFRQVVAVQAKHWQPNPPVGIEVVEQLIKGIEAESADLGMVITSGAISDEASQFAEQYFEEKGVRIELIDGEQFAKLIVEHGIRTS